MMSRIPWRDHRVSGQLCARDGCGSFHNDEQIICRRAVQAPLHIRVLAPGVFWSDCKNLEVKYEDSA
jgi:hypothetical protein